MTGPSTAAPTGPRFGACRHGVPDITDPAQRAQYMEGLKDLLQQINRYLTKENKKCGKKAAEKWVQYYPELVDENMLALMGATGTKMILQGDARAQFVVQAVAEAMGVVEKMVHGHSTVSNELDKEKDADAGVGVAKEQSLIRFYQTRVPCECLDPTPCGYDECEHILPLKRLKS